MVRHGVQGKSDPNFKPDPNLKYVWDDKKNVYRAVYEQPKKAKEDK